MDKARTKVLLDSLMEQFDEAERIVEQQKNMIESLQQKTKGLNSQLSVKDAEITELNTKINKFKKAFEGVM